MIRREITLTALESSLGDLDVTFVTLPALMGVVFEVPDKNGIPVRLEEKVWYGHILHGHPEVEHHLDAIQATIADPITIHRHAGSIIYSRLGAAEKPPLHLL